MRSKHFPLVVIAVLAISALAYAALTPLEGTASSVDYDAKTFYVGSTFVYTTDATIVVSNGVTVSFDQLDEGDSVRVMGTTASTGFEASKICIKQACDNSQRNRPMCDCPNGGTCDGTGPYGKGRGGR